MSLLGSVATVGGFTMLSRVLGLVRDVMIARYLGTGPVADAFTVAFRFPNLFRRLFAEGAFNAAFVPLYAKALEGEGGARATRFAEEVMSVLLTALIVFTGLAQVAMPLLMYAMAPGFAADPAKWQLTIVLTQIAFPYLLFMSLTALLSGVLNSHRRFAAAAAAPVLLNLVLVASLIAVDRLQAVGLVAPTPESFGFGLVWGVSLAGVLQLLLMLWGCARLGVTVTLRWPRLTADVRRLVALGVPGLIAGGVTQLNILVSTMVASQDDGAVAVLNYADRLYQLPLGLIGVAMGVVLLPEIARRLRGGDEGAALWTQNRGCELSLLLTLPAAVALVVIPLPIVRTLFEGGAFSYAASLETAWTLALFALGLPAFVLIKVFQPAFFAREDTATPMRFSVMSIAVNIVGAVALYGVVGFLGIPIATTLASWLNAGLLYVTATRRGLFRSDARLRTRSLRILAASLGMGLVLLALEWPLLGAFDGGLLVKLAALSALVGAGLAVYGALALGLKATSLADLRLMALRRAPGGDAAAAERLRQGGEGA